MCRALSDVFSNGFFCSAEQERMLPADRITPLGKRPVIASLSIGATRVFRVKRASAAPEEPASKAAAGAASPKCPCYLCDTPLAEPPPRGLQSIKRLDLLRLKALPALVSSVCCVTQPSCCAMRQNQYETRSFSCGDGGSQGLRRWQGDRPAHLKQTCQSFQERVYRR